MKERIYKVEAVVELEIPVDELPMTTVKSIDEISSNEAVEGKLVQLHTRIKKDLEGECVKVKSGVYENIAMGWITEVKKISLGTRTWEEVK
jgi:hypothetical protein